VIERVVIGLSRAAATAARIGLDRLSFKLRGLQKLPLGLPLLAPVA